MKKAQGLKPHGIREEVPVYRQIPALGIDAW